MQTYGQNAASDGSIDPTQRIPGLGSIQCFLKAEGQGSGPGRIRLTGKRRLLNSAIN